MTKQLNEPPLNIERPGAAGFDRPQGSSRGGRKDFQRQLEPGLELLAEWLDNVFHIPGLGIRFGIDALVGLIPGVGDTLTSLASLYILQAGRRYGVPRVTMLRMAGNIAIDYVLGAVPFFGDAFDVYWKANKRNVALLREHVQAAPAEDRRARRGDGWFVAGLIVVLALVLIGSITVAWIVIAAVFQWLRQMNG